MKFRTVVKDLGLIEYKDAWDFQEESLGNIVKRREFPDNAVENLLIFCEHPHVYTLGKSGQQNNLLINDSFLNKINATYSQTNRGGDITYHGPGQIVVYPLFDLNNMKIGVKEYVYKLEEVIISTLKEYSILSDRMEGATGVWLDKNEKAETRKICAIGVRVSRFITMHGFAFNINTDLSYFNHINPCGFVDKGVTSLSKELGKNIDINSVKKQLLYYFEKEFNLDL